MWSRAVELLSLKVASEDGLSGSVCLMAVWTRISQCERRKQDQVSGLRFEGLEFHRLPEGLGL